MTGTEVQRRPGPVGRVDEQRGELVAEVLDVDVRHALNDVRQVLPGGSGGRNDDCAVVIDAIGRGTGEGLHLALNVGAMLISFLALIALVNAGLGLIGNAVGVDLSMQRIFGAVFAPVAWSLGVPWRDAPTIGNLLGTRMVLNEFVAYSSFAQQMAGGLVISDKAAIMLSYCLLGFANFSSIAIQIGGIGGLAPARRHADAIL